MSRKIIQIQILTFILLNSLFVSGQDETIYKYLWINNDWQKYTKETIYKNAGNLIIEKIDQEYETATSNWINQERETFDYNNQDLLVGNNEYQWNSVGNKWNDSYKYTDYVYDNNNLTEFYSKYWNGTKWENSYKFNKIYDNTNRLIESSNSSWRDWDTAYVFHAKARYYYTNPLLTIMYTDYYDWTDTALCYMKTYSHYDQSGNLIEYILGHNNGYPNWYYRKDVYDYQNEKKQEILCQTREAPSDWVNNYVENYYYNINDSLEEIIRKEWENNQWVNKRKEIFTYSKKTPYFKYSITTQNWDIPSSTWINYRLEEFYQESVGVTEISKLPCTIKNPFTNTDIFYCSKYSANTLLKIQVFDMSGKRIYSNFFNNGSKPISMDINNGFYVVNISDKTKSIYSDLIYIY